jgi:glycosyltransferase involved in cell wall biosynthesis
MARQTYANLQIIISDNCSSNPEVEDVAKQFCAQDSRIRYVRQSTNIGVVENFRYVLRESSGEYFMWAADDDEWEPTFIEACFGMVSPNCSAMTGFDTVHRAKKSLTNNPIPILSCHKSPYRNAQAFLGCLQPSLIYGLHPKASLDFFLAGSRNFSSGHFFRVALRLYENANGYPSLKRRRFL